MTNWEYYLAWKRFGWSPSQVDAMPAWVVRYLLEERP